MTLEEVKLRQTRIALMDTLERLDKIKKLLLSKDKVLKEEILKIIDEENK